MFPVREAILLVGFFIVAMSWVQVAAKKARTTGRIIGFEWKSPPSKIKVKKPRISFRVDGVEYSFLPSLHLAGDNDEKRLGAEVPVAYNPNKPSDADIATPGRRYGPPIVLTGLYIWVLVIAFTK